MVRDVADGAAMTADPRLVILLVRRDRQSTGSVGV